jgi:hypothetical protein
LSFAQIIGKKEKERRHNSVKYHGTKNSFLGNLWNKEEMDEGKERSAEKNIAAKKENGSILLNKKISAETEKSQIAIG